MRVGDTTPVTLTVENPRIDGHPVAGYWTLSFPSQLRVFDASGSEVVAYPRSSLSKI